MVVFACCEIGENKDTSNRQKGVIAFGHRKGHNVEEVGEFAGSQQ